jgi:DNA-binding transcriptional regulator YhcF (GntR family)
VDARTPRYTEIAAELRRRIEAGELAPGDRVPSTREITRRWDVAMATATKVLTRLRHEGLVTAVPGVGTVVAAPRRPVRAGQAPRPRRSAAEELTLTRIVTSAIAVADAEGLPAVSMRRVAGELGVATMSLYRHVEDKDRLLMEMMDAAFAQWPLPGDPPDGWRARLELAGRALWSMFRRHPWLAPAMSVTRPQAIRNGIPYTEWVLTALDGLGLSPQTMFTAHITLFNYVRGTAINLESEAEAEALSGMDNEEWMDTQEPELEAILASGRFPMFERLASVGYDFDLDELFEFGMQRLLDGLQALIQGHDGS